MRTKLVAAVATFLLLGGVASAHRLDEYLQATIVSVDKNHVEASMRLIPGVAVAPAVIAAIDANGDGILSQAEQQAYAERVVADLALTIDGSRLTPRLVSATYPAIAEMKEGLGEIHIEFSADIPPGGANRRLILESRHQFPNSAYLVNALAPTDPDIQIVAQTRNEQQSFYQLDYVQAGPLQTGGSTGLGEAGFLSLFRLGIRHIAEGTDHLLFLLALLLPAPLLAVGSRWAGIASVRGSLVRILKVVTAFTIGHSMTLALAASGLVHVPSRPIEVLIAVSILVSAIHALRPIFPGKEAGIAAFFGLIHGLAFAATLTQLGLGRWDRLVGILAFNLGIETMQLIVVAAIMPSLILISRTSAYRFVRIGGALFAGIASVGWIMERTFGIRTSTDAVVGALARYAPAIAVGLFLVSVACWRLSFVRADETRGVEAAAGR